MQAVFDVVQDRSGNAVSGAYVTVYNSSNTLATLYSDNNGTPLVNPTITNFDGEYQFYAANGTYRIEITATGYAGQSIPGVVLFDPTDSGAISSNNVSFTQSGTSAVTRTVQSRLRDTVSVKDFGAVGDGVADDTAEIQAALTAGAGKLVFVPEGVYLVSNALSIPANTHLQGAGVGSVIKSLTLVNGGTNAGHRQLDIRSVAGVRVSDLKLDAGSMTGFTGGMRSICCFEATDYIIERCVFVTPGAAVASLNCARYSILDNDISIQSSTGVAVHDGIIDQWYGSNNFVIRGNRIRGNGVGLWPILMTGATTDSVAAPIYNYVVSENHIFNCIQPGIWAMGRNGLTYNFQITDNIVDTITTYYGIAVTDAYNFVVKGNVLRNTGLCSIRVYAESPTWGTHAAKYGVISDNICQNANVTASTGVDTGSAISITDASEYIELVNNVVRGATHRYAVFLGTNTSNIDVKGESYIAGVVGDILNQATLASTNKLPGANFYQPTLTAVANVSASTAYTNTMYKRMGNIVQVYGRLEVTPTAAASTNTELGISLPIASNFTGTTDASGTASTSFGLVANVFSDSTNDRVTLRFPSSNTSNNVFSFHFQYIVK